MSHKKPWQMSVVEYKEWASELFKGEKLLMLAFTQDTMGRPGAHRMAIWTAMCRGKIKSHPDYPDLNAKNRE